jgi:hypothetical protein
LVDGLGRGEAGEFFFGAVVVVFIVGGGGVETRDVAIGLFDESVYFFDVLLEIYFALLAELFEKRRC